METRQVVVAAQNEVELRNCPLDIEPLRGDEMLIETDKTFISAGTELANYTGKDPAVFEPGTWCAYPWRSGYANVGIVREVGKGVTRAKVGDRIFTYGPHAAMFRWSQEQLVVVVPEYVDSATAAASRMAGVAATAMIVAEIRGNSWVVVFGLGMVGILAGQAFRIRGCRVIGVDPIRPRCRLAHKCRFHGTIDGTADNVREALSERTGGEMASISVEATGLSQVALQAMDLTADFGQLILLGSPRVPVQCNVTELLSAIHLRWVTLRGALEWCLPTYSVPKAGPLSQFSKQQMIFDWIRRGDLAFAPLISHHMKPEQIKEAYEGLLHHPEEYVGVVLDWS